MAASILVDWVTILREFIFQKYKKKKKKKNRTSKGKSVRKLSVFCGGYPRTYHLVNFMPKQGRGTMISWPSDWSLQ